ncbi:MAG: ribosomal protein S18-alanine N-acetyltransferase [Actinobacteria bacterium]|nr:ribosomal protein S18-alanine N-acetyltransferase [Actinomycetota bacterium]MBI3686784.1 ribosomal protein S18-alanine N-acetyltransferase [Actinomycetota bacterium]
MRTSDVPAVAELEGVLFAEQPWSARMLTDELTLPGRYYLVAVGGAGGTASGGAIVGYGGLADFGVEAHIMTLGVRTDWQRAGLGGRLLAGLLAEADRRQVHQVLLEVAVDNAAARRLYTRAGFRPVGVRKGYYEATGTDAVVMARG